MIKILIIEDCLVFKGLLKLILSPYPFQIDYISSVEEVNKSICPTLAYDMIISDYNLPGRNGFDFLKQMKEDGASAVPLVLMTANRRAQSECNDLGNVIDAFMLKPFSRRTLDSVFRKFIGASRQLQN